MKHNFHSILFSAYNFFGSFFFLGYKVGIFVIMSQKCNGEPNTKYTVLVIYYAILICRKKGSNKKSFIEKLKSKMADFEGKAATADVTSGDMVFEAILEDGVFRFDCSTSDRDLANPSFSFLNSKVRDTPIQVHKVPSYVPKFECLLGKQIVKLEVSKHFFP